MLRHFIIMVGLLVAASLAQADEAGRIVFVSGQAQVATRPIALGEVILEGDELATGPDGYIYLKTVDNGFLILRPNSRARIAAYRIDTQNPANTRVKLELLSGVARAISGEGVKQSRQNFRFNTPVAAIGVRGTDFTVFTDQETSRVAVLSGGVVVSGFSGACGPEGSGPCEGNASRELFANQVGVLLQIRKGQAAPQMLPSQSVSPDLNAPPRPDEPDGKTSSAGSATLAANDVDLDAQRTTDLLLKTKLPQVPVSQPEPQPPLPPPAPLEPSRQMMWGRWQVVAGKAPDLDVSKTSSNILAINSYFAILRTNGADWLIPQSGTVGFSLNRSEAYIHDEPKRQLTPATLENGQLQVDFGQTAFSTSFDLVSQKNERFKFYSQGQVTRDGQLLGSSQLAPPTNMAVRGALNPENNGNSAAYIFQGRIDDKRVASGVTYWTK